MSAIAQFYAKFKCFTDVVLLQLIRNVTSCGHTSNNPKIGVLMQCSRTEFSVFERIENSPKISSGIPKIFTVFLHCKNTVKTLGDGVRPDLR